MKGTYMDTLIINNEYIISDGYEKGLKDFIKYLQNNNERICLLERHTWYKINNDTHIAYEIVYNGEPAFESLVKHMKSVNHIEYHNKTVNEITQNMIDNWATPYIIGQQNESTMWSIYTVSSRGDLFNYSLGRISNFSLNSIGDTITNADLAVFRIRIKNIGI